MLGLGFVCYKSRSVARELTDPPFYHVPTRSQVEATYQALAQGQGLDPGGTWVQDQAGERELWILKRRQPARSTVLLLHGFGDDRWGTSPALRWFPDLDAAIFTYLGRDDALREGRQVPWITFGAKEAPEVVAAVHALERRGVPRHRIVLMGRSMGASVGLLALARLEAEGRGPLGGIIWEGAPASSRDFGERLVRGRRDRFWHGWVAPLIGDLGSRWAASRGQYDREATDVMATLGTRRLETPSLCFLASRDRLAPPETQRMIASRFIQCQIVEVPTWHLNCSNILGEAYTAHIQKATRRWTS